MKILIVSGEYPPMTGGVGRYTFNLVSALRKKNASIDIRVAIGSTRGEKTDKENYANTNGIYYDVVKKGDKRNSQRLLELIDKTKPDVVNVQYERGLYETDTTLSHIVKRVIFGSTLDKFYRRSPVPVLSTLHTLFPYDEYMEYTNVRSLRKGGKFSIIPVILRAPIRRWIFQRRYRLLLQVGELSDELICPAGIIRKVIGRGVVIYHGSEPSPSCIPSPLSREKYRQEFRLPTDKRLLLAFGYVGSYKGFQILDQLNLPKDWSLILKQNKHDRGLESPVKIKNAISLSQKPLSETELSKLFLACDALILPYNIVSISGVLFDALAHGLPFVASDLAFFREFAEMGLGITCKRTPEAFSKSIAQLSSHYKKFSKNVHQFSPQLKWSAVADSYLKTCYNLCGKRTTQ